MFKKATSQKVIPEMKKVTKPVIPSIKLLPRGRNNLKIVPDMSNSTTNNSKSASFFAQPRSTKKNKSVLIRSKEVLETSDSLCFEEYKKCEIFRSRKVLNAKFPYWFIDGFNDLDLTRSFQNTLNFPRELFNRNNNLGIQNWISVYFI